MEPLTQHGQIVDDLLSRAQWQVAAVEALGRALDTEKEGLRRLHRAAQLDAIHNRVKREVELQRLMELASRCSYTEGKLVGALAMFGIGVFKANTGQVNQEPFLAGMRHSRDYLRKTEPSGTIMVAVGSRGSLSDVRVVSISSIAREQRRPESEVVAAIEAEGSILMTPEAFFQLLHAQRQKVLTGSSKGLPMLPRSEEPPDSKPP
ncbi:MAG: hypothetical protein JW753_02615 [Dehalococcoidia bacterium]|nr:hypothetical protein [Dehalococcoidia bacterium]